MRSLNSVSTIKSKKYDGVEFQVLTLNVIQRAVRDAGIAEHRLEYSRLSAERGTLLDSLVGKGGTIEEREKRYDDLTPVDRFKLIDLNSRAELIHQQFIAPAAIKAALTAVTGFEIDGKPADADTLILHAPDDLLMEAYDACTRASGMTGEEVKN